MCALIDVFESTYKAQAQSIEAYYKARDTWLGLAVARAAVFVAGSTSRGTRRGQGTKQAASGSEPDSNVYRNVELAAWRQAHNSLLYSTSCLVFPV